MPVHIKQGDCLQHENPAVIAHCCNDLGLWGAGFVLKLSQVNKNPENKYKEWYRDKVTVKSSGEKVDFRLGNVQYCWFDPKMPRHIVANIIGQHSVGWDKENDRAPLRYWALRKGLQNVLDTMKLRKISDYDVVSPLLGCTMAGGHVDEMYSIINDIFGNSPVNYYLYAFTEKDFENLKKVVDSFA